MQHLHRDRWRWDLERGHDDVDISGAHASLIAPGLLFSFLLEGAPKSVLDENDQVIAEHEARLMRGEMFQTPPGAGLRVHAEESASMRERLPLPEWGIDHAWVISRA